MNMVPKEFFPQKGSGFNSEEKVFNSLLEIEFKKRKNLDPVGFHSLRIPPSKRNYGEGESDFVLLFPGFILILEVKGGPVSYNPETGKWRTGDQDRGSKSPFAQATGNMYSIITDLKKRFKAFEKNFNYGWCVFFSGMQTFDIDGFEFDQNLTIDKTKAPNSLGLKNTINSIKNYWISNTGNREKFNENFNVNLFNEIKNYLRPRYEYHPSFLEETNTLDEQIHQYTVNQAEILNKIDEGIVGTKKYIISGGAGTGKTFILGGMAWNTTHSGKRSLITCKSKDLALKIGDELWREDFKVVPFDEIESLGEKYNKYFDYLFVDEAQDIFNETLISKTNNLLKLGWENSKCYLFIDKQRQSRLESKFDEETWQIISSDSETLVFNLAENLRNTKPIIDFIKDEMNINLEKPKIGEGINPKIINANSCEEARGELKKILNKYHEENLKGEDIVIVCSDEIELEKIIYDHKTLSPFKITRNYSDSNNKYIYACSTTNYKGLEAKFVINVEVESIWNREIEEIRDFLYVSSTRGKIGLNLIINKSKFEEFKKKIVEYE